MIGAYKDNKDLYSLIAAEVYHNNYEDNREFFPDGTMNPEGKHRRSSVKSLLLGLMYGRGEKSVADQIKTHDGPTTADDIKEAKRVTRSFFDSFPKVEKWIDKTQRDAKTNGYVEDLWGRRRRLPDIQRPEFDIKYKDLEKQFNPLLRTTGISIDTKKLDQYNLKLMEAHNAKEKQKIKDEALKEGIEIHDNGGFIAQAERQCVNARVQGGAASMSKRAMIIVHNDPVLKELGFHLVNVVHDELIGEVEIKNKDAAAKRLSELMISAAKPECVTPMKCDADIFHAWYEDVYSAELKEYYEILLKSMTKDDAIKKLKLEKSELTEKQLLDMLGENND